MDDDLDYCSCIGDDIEEIDGQCLKWVFNVNQFFNMFLIVENGFDGGIFEMKMLFEEGEDLKLLVLEIEIFYGCLGSEFFVMYMYVGLNEFDCFYNMGYGLQDVIFFGWSIFGFINCWIICLVFNFLFGFIGSVGIVIFVLIFVVKLVLYLLIYKMFYFQLKMAVLKF